jgi:hypothetical protein
VDGTRSLNCARGTPRAIDLARSRRATGSDGTRICSQSNARLADGYSPHPRDAEVVVDVRKQKPLRQKPTVRKAAVHANG